MNPPIPPPSNPNNPYNSQNQPNPPGFLTPEEKNWAMFSHLASFSAYVGLPFGHVLGPLVIWIIKKDQSQFVDQCGKESVNYGISLTIYLIISVILAFFCVGFFLIVGLAIFDIIVTIMAAVAASNGQHYRYPGIFRFVS